MDMSRRTFGTAAAAAAASSALGLGTADAAHAASASGSAAPSGRARVTSAPFGKLADGSEVTLYTVDTGTGFRATVMNYGGIMQTLEVPDRHGRLGNVLLGYDNLAAYVAGTTYFGALIGRYGNRIGGAKFTLDGTTYHLSANNNGNTLHGGAVGFDRHIWATEPFTTADGSAGLVLSLTSPDGDQGFPGTLHAKVTLTLTARHQLRFDYEATTDKPTVVNLTNHNYFNLGGEASGDIYSHQARIDASRITPTDALLIPTGKFADVAGTPYDFRRPKAIGADIRDGRNRLSQQLLNAKGYDMNFVLDKGITGSPQEFARFEHPGTGRAMAVATTEPGVQFYSGAQLDATLVGTSGHIYQQGDGFAFETQHYPDSPNEPSFPSTVLRPGHTYRSSSVYTFSAS
ncbi:galactose mutarotase [Mangrovactinospora gilvigrisea]|uniref:Aldose 1-epimerase n=1 Tax=Mangrovactinospora gilvigrisea TaxID=1428644 RepID=A0A1J7BI38_9ACTN|nr:aldose epimerase family protein [Mangrovactinospora gilvigrisea]OIV38331.1 galactose mutarotase [Mangrovactinospora gilvigrisea]